MSDSHIDSVIFAAIGACAAVVIFGLVGLLWSYAKDYIGFLHMSNEAEDELRRRNAEWAARNKRYERLR